MGGGRSLNLHRLCVLCVCVCVCVFLSVRVREGEGAPREIERERERGRNLLKLQRRAQVRCAPNGAGPASPYAVGGREAVSERGREGERERESDRSHKHRAVQRVCDQEQGGDQTGL